MCALHPQSWALQASLFLRWFWLSLGVYAPVTSVLGQTCISGVYWLKNCRQGSCSVVLCFASGLLLCRELGIAARTKRSRGAAGGQGWRCPARACALLGQGEGGREVPELLVGRGLTSPQEQGVHSPKGAVLPSPWVHLWLSSARSSCRSCSKQLRPEALEQGELQQGWVRASKGNRGLPAPP